MSIDTSSAPFDTQPEEPLTDEQLAIGYAEYFHHVDSIGLFDRSNRSIVSREAIVTYILAGNRVELMLLQALAPDNELRRTVESAAFLPSQGRKYTF